MKLLGVEFLDYARFEKIFVPLETGIHVLAGKNNSGKTALLRGLSALSALPFENSLPFSPDIARYARSQQPQANYFMNVHFAYESEDRSLFSANLEIWPEFRTSSVKRWVFNFQVFPVVSAIVLVGANLEFGSQVIRVAELGGGVLHQYSYDDRRNIVGRSVLNSTGQGIQVGSATVRFYTATGLLSAFKNLNKIRMVNAHRVVGPNLALQALDKLSENADTLAPFLDTAVSNDRETFDRIQDVIKDIFLNLN